MHLMGMELVSELVCEEVVMELMDKDLVRLVGVKLE